MNAPLVLISSSYPIGNNGSEAAGSFVADLVEELARLRPIRVVAPGTADAHERSGANIEVFRFAAPARALSLLRPWIPRDLAWLARVMRGGLAATRAAAGDGADAIVALWGLPCGEWARRVASERRVPYAVWMLGSDVWTLGRIPLLRGLLARVIRQAGRAYADGYRLASDAQALSHTPVAFLPSTRAIGGSRAPPPPRAAAPYRLLFLGRWHPNKGIDLLLDALGLLDAAAWSRIACVEIQGGGPLEALVRARVADLRGRGRAVELGTYLDKTQAEAAIARADWLLIPSRIESIPVIFSDAMKLDRPVVATPVGDLPRLLDSMRCGICARGTDAPAIAQAIAQALGQDAAAYLPQVRQAAALFSLPSIAAELDRFAHRG